MAEDFKLTHAREFTTIEVQGLTLWNALQDVHENALAQDLLDATLMHEHYTSLLDNNQALRLNTEVIQQAQLRAKFDSLVQQATQTLANIASVNQQNASTKLPAD